MRHQASTVAVLGDGGWGTTLAIHLHRLGHRVHWWGVFPEYAKAVNQRHENVKFLPGIRIPQQLQMVSELLPIVELAQVVVLAIPSQYMRTVVWRLKSLPLDDKIFISAAKGLEQTSLKRMSEVIAEELGSPRVAALSGPNIASEIAQRQPASSVIASHDARLASHIQRMFMDERLRLYTSTDVIGVELGGALKNPLAIAAGISDGLGCGANTKAALITRGVVEMARLGVTLGARQETCWGLSGLGDLVTTCLSGRNHWLGEQLGRGRSLKTVLASTPMVIEGVDTTKAALALGQRLGVELPIIEQVHAVLFERRAPRKALQTLMLREGKSESS